MAIVVMNGSDGADVGVCGDIISATSLGVWLAIGIVVIGWLIFSVVIAGGVVSLAVELWPLALFRPLLLKLWLLAL